MSPTRRVTVDDGALAYREQGSGEPLLLLHSGFIADSMLPLLDQPLLQDHRMIAYRRRGYGDSDPAGGSRSISRAACGRGGDLLVSGRPTDQGRSKKVTAAPWPENDRSRRRQSEQSTATASAAQISVIRLPASRPRRSASTATDTLSTESRLTAQSRGIGSSVGSRTTSLARPRMVVVQGATKARRSRGIAASRDRTTTGRRPASGSSHHHTSPRAGSITRQQQPGEM